MPPPFLQSWDETAGAAEVAADAAGATRTRAAVAARRPAVIAAVTRNEISC
jgi:hypothetical protein